MPTTFRRVRFTQKLLLYSGGMFGRPLAPRDLGMTAIKSQVVPASELRARPLVLCDLSHSHLADQYHQLVFPHRPVHSITRLSRPLWFFAYECAIGNPLLNFNASISAAGIRELVSTMALLPNIASRIYRTIASGFVTSSAKFDTLIRVIALEIKFSSSAEEWRA